MYSRQNKIANILFWIGVIEIVAGFILGLSLGNVEVSRYRNEQIWSVTFIWWIASFVSGMLIIGISEIIEQLHKLNIKNNKVPEDNDLELLDD